MRASDLAAALAPFRSVIDKRTTIPILTYVRLTANKKGLTLSGTDLDTQLTHQLPFKGDFDVAVPLETLLQALASIGDSETTLARVDGKFEIAGPVVFQLRILPADEYPVIETGEGKGISFVMGADLFRSALDAVSPAVSTEETRYYLNGIFVQRIEDQIGFTATDGHRLHMSRFPAPAGLEKLDDGTGIIVPRGASRLAQQLLKADDVPDVGLTVWRNSNKAMITIGDAVIVTKTIDGHYPEYQRVIPTDATGSFTASASELLVAANAAASVGSERHRAFSIEPAAHRISHKGDLGNATALVTAEGQGTLPASIGFNARYFRDIIQQRPEGRAILRMSDAGAPMLVEFEDDPTFRAVLMPMRIP